MKTSYREDMAAESFTHRVSDDELLRQTAEGHAPAFSELFRRRHGEVFRFAVHMTASVPAAEDIVQEVFLVLMRDAVRYQPGRSSVIAWLCGIARNCVRQRLAREGRLQPLADTDGDGAAGLADARENPLETLVRAERADLIRTAVQALPLPYREAIVLCDLQELSYGEAAAALACPIGTVRSRLHRARTMLGDRLSALGLASTAMAGAPSKTSAALGSDEQPGPIEAETRGCFA
jgi:RNA polymerase sigma-70 factor (ECF subfamily)